LKKGNHISNSTVSSSKSVLESKAMESQVAWEWNPQRIRDETSLMTADLIICSISNEYGL